MPYKPRIFISAVTSEFKQVRHLVAMVLERLGYDAIRQDIFGTEHGDLRGMLRRQIDSCEGVIHIVGRGYGAEPPVVDPSLGRVSYTQFEFLYAQSRTKRTWVIFAEDGCSRDTPVEQLDLPPEAGRLNPAAYQSERRTLQDAWRARLMRDGHLRHGAASDTELELKIERLKDEFAQLRLAERVWRRNVSYGLVALAAFVLVAIGMGWYALRDQLRQGQRLESLPEMTAAATVEEVRQLFRDPDVLIGKFKTHIRKRSEEEVSKARERSADWREIDEIEKRRDAALEDVENLIATIREGLAGNPDPIFTEAARLLAEKGVDEAIEYLETKRPETMEQVQNLIETQSQAEEKKRELLCRVLLEAELHESNLAWDPALALYTKAAEKAPQWSRARRQLGSLLKDLARYEEAKPHLLAAVECAVDDDVAVAADALGELYAHTANWQQAEPLMCRALTIAEQYHGTGHPDVARYLNNLGQLLKATNRFAEAELVMRRALAIDEQYVQQLSHLPSVSAATLEAAQSRLAIRLGNLASLLFDTNRLAEAGTLMRRAVITCESACGAEHPHVARYLNNLAWMLKETNQLANAELLIRRALTIDEQTYGPRHPHIAFSLNNLALMLQDTKRFAEAEPLMRRALEIDELSYGPDHPSSPLKKSCMALRYERWNILAIGGLFDGTRQTEAGTSGRVVCRQ